MFRLIVRKEKEVEYETTTKKKERKIYVLKKSVWFNLIAGKGKERKIFNVKKEEKYRAQKEIVWFD